MSSMTGTALRETSQVNHLHALMLGSLMVLLATSLPAHALLDELGWTLALDGRFDSNTGFAPDNSSEKKTSTTSVMGTVDWTPLQTATRRIGVSASPFYRRVESLEDLSRWGIELGLNAQQNLNAEFTSPFIAADVKFTVLEHANSEIRDGYVLDSDIAVGRQFNPYFGARLGARFRWQESTNNEPVGTLLDRNSDEVHDLFAYGGFARLEINPFPKTALFVEYAYSTGDVAATGDSLAFNNPAAFDSARDFAFEEGTRFLSWRIDADQHEYSVGGTQVISEHLKVNLTASYLDAKGEFGNDYSNMVVTASISWTF